MAELRHSSSIGSRATASPAASAVASSPFSSDYDSAAAADDDHNGRDRYSRDRSFRSFIQPFLPHYFFPNDDLYRAHPYRSKISILILVAVVLAAVISVSSVIKRLVSQCPFSVLCIRLCLIVHAYLIRCSLKVPKFTSFRLLFDEFAQVNHLFCGVFSFSCFMILIP